MSARSTLNSYVKMSVKDKLTAIMIFFQLGVARAIILVVPFRIVARFMGKVESETDNTAYKDDKFVPASRYAHLVNITSRRTPWLSTCFARALVLQLYLKRQGIPHTVYFGLRKKPEDDVEIDKAHAWVRVGDQYLSGGGQRHYYVSVASFSS